LEMSEPPLSLARGSSSFTQCVKSLRKLQTSDYGSSDLAIGDIQSGAAEPFRTEFAENEQLSPTEKDDARV